jgi:acyl-CoA thioesterase FadM
VKPAELGPDGTLSLTGHVHRFSASCLQVVTRFGMTPSYMRQEGRGFSTFETRLRLHGDAVRAGDLVALRSAVRHVGGSSIRLLHRMYDARTGRLVAELHQSGVHFDLEARRSAPWPEALRDGARAMTVA